MKNPRLPFAENDPVIFYDRKMRVYYDILHAGRKTDINGNHLPHDDIIGRMEGFRIVSHKNVPFWVVRPTINEHILNMRRGATVIYPKELGIIVQYADIFPGAKVVEAGFGSGALTTALLRAVGPGGVVISYEVREDFINNARHNLQNFMGEIPNHVVRQADIYEEMVEEEIDRLLLDLPEPWRALPRAVPKLRSGAIITSYSPTVPQMKSFVDAVGQTGCHSIITSLEIMLRTWHIDGQSVRPDQRMVGHTGFLVFARIIK